MKTGFFVSKFLPPHIGHIWAIEQASQQCDELFVLVAEHPETCKKLCETSNIPYFDLATKTRWIKEALKDYKNIKIVTLREDRMKPMPEGWADWADAVKKIIGKHIDYIFGSEPEYAPYYEKYFPDSEYVLQDVNRTHYNISATQIRADLDKGFPYIIDSAKPFFEKVLKSRQKK